MRRVRGVSFKTRVFFGCLLVALVPLIFTSVVVTRLFAAFINRQMAAEGARQLEEASEKLSQLFKTCEKACEAFTADGTAARVMVDKDAFEMQKDMYLSLYQAVREIYGSASFSIYDSGGKLRFTTDTASKNSSLPVHWGLLRKAQGMEGITYYRTDPYLPETDKNTLMQGAYPLENSHGVRTGYVVLDFSQRNFDNLLTGFYSSGDTLLLLDSHQKLIYCSNPEYGEEAVNDIIAHGCRNKRGAKGLDVYTSCFWSSEPSLGIYIVLKQSAPVSAEAIRTMGTVSILLSALGLSLCLLISEALSRGIALPVSQLDKAMAMVKSGDLSIRIHTNRRDELGRLSESFNQMTGDLQKYLEDAIQKQKDLNQTTIKLYQAQLNPHFLYNTLDTIKWSARIHKIPEIAVLAENLALILRKSISSRPFITLKEELDTIDSYIQIQKIRFTGQFLYITEIPDQLEDCMVPRMILQPLVENAIIHGLAGYENGYICIFADQRGSVLNISITDDGCGMDQEMADWINSNNPLYREGHLGLYHVLQILKTYYGQEYGIRAEATAEGTAIALRLPIQKEAADV